MPGPTYTTSGPQAAVFSYFCFNPAVHTHEKPYEILINMPRATEKPESYRRSNQEFEPREAVVNDVRGRESEFGLDQQGVCWRKWEGPREWRGIDGDAVKRLGHERIKRGYLKEIEGFVKRELELEGGSKVDKVVVFDYKVRKAHLALLFLFVQQRDQEKRKTTSTDTRLEWKSSYD